MKITPIVTVRGQLIVIDSTKPLNIFIVVLGSVFITGILMAIFSSMSEGFPTMLFSAIALIVTTVSNLFENHRVEIRKNTKEIYITYRFLIFQRRAPETIQYETILFELNQMSRSNLYGMYYDNVNHGFIIDGLNATKVAKIKNAIRD